MKIHYTNNQTHKKLNLIPLLEAEEAIIFDEIHLSKTIFSGKKDSLYFYEKDENIFLFIGLGKDPDYKSIKATFRKISAKQKTYFKEEAKLFLSGDLSTDNIEAIISGLWLGTYQLGHYKKDKKHHPLESEDFIFEVNSYSDVKNAIDKGLKIANAQLETYHLVDLPPNKITPKHLADWAIETGKNFGFSVEVFGHQKSKDLGLDAFVSVGKGSANESQFIVMDYQPENAKKHIGLVGKGITFDTGGLNIKTAGMVHMKCDMAGGAAVLGAMQLIADLQLPYRVTAIVPACENSVDANSFLPSDVIGSYSGHSIEIIDTDAEGRLILADGLSYLIKNYNPETVIDLATLTGSSVATFGNECGALFTNNELLVKQLQLAGDGIGERLWPLPLWDAYKSDIESEIADVKNYSGKPVGGAISAAKFLEFFTENHTSWAHLDIAGVTFVDDEFAKTKHATAFGVHLITNFIENQ
ncbi:leucyl aminopeptidase family protein [Flavobacterium azooxidireducens]|uniref:Leucyl aminopeptidase family protein n=1 Tax=Flavobacterium azooxidireducens TaxID=1871076 RepID=A0ABY4KHL4_9FLAO|nr:leucyl aminopeptidase family protein [Flavobacterium azooxidireducens]UPQ78922.1 leucyl aminopeptidase family protein [Flavobacterium azooxidireducens]